MVKRAREQALRERRERKQQKKEARAAEKLYSTDAETAESDTPEEAAEE